jgi:hypothetical protein
MNGDQLLELMKQESLELYDLCQEFTGKAVDLGFVDWHVVQDHNTMRHRVYCTFKTHVAKQLYDFVCKRLDEQSKLLTGDDSDA